MSKLYDDELSEGFLEIADNMKKYGGIELKDDNTTKGGVAFKGETLQDFLDDLADNSIETLDDVNNVLKDNGIQPIEEDLDDEVEFEEYMGTTTWDKSRDRKGLETYNGKEDVGEIDAYIEYDDNKQKILVTITKYVSKNEDGTLKSEETTKEFTDVEEAINWANEKIGKTKIQESLDTNNKIYKMAQELGKLLANKELTLDVSIYILGKRFHIKDDGTLEYDIDANPRDYFDYVRTPNILSMSFEGGLYDVLNYGNSDFLDQFFRKYGLFFELGNAWNGSVYTIDDKDDYEWDKIIYNQDDAITENLNDKDGDNKKMGTNNSIKNESIDTKELLKYQQEPREVEEKSREVVDPAYAKASDDINQANDKKEEIVTMEEIPTTEDRFKKPSVNQKGAREMKLTLDESLFEEVDDNEIKKEANSIRKIMRNQGMESQKSKEDYVKFLKKIHEIRDKKKSLKESKSNILSYHEFVDYLDSINNGYTGVSKVKNDKGVGYRYNLENKLTREQHSYLEQYDNVFFGEAQYKYAPETKYDTVILLDRMNKIEESKDSAKDMSYDVGYDHYGSKHMSYFNGSAYIEYDGGAGNIQWLVRGQNHRYYWENSANISEPYVFDDYDSALKVQIKYGGEILPYLENTNGSKIEESKEPRYTAREVNGKGYIYDKKFSNKVPSNVDKDIETARKSVDRWNKEEINEGMKSFLNDLGNDEIQYFTHKNRFNYDIKQVRVDNKNKTYELGQFKIGDRLNSTQNGAEFRRLVDELKNRGYKEISKSEEILEETRIPKTKEVKVLQGNYGYGWDDLVEYELDDSTSAQDLRDYRKNEPEYPHRIIHRRIQNPEYKEETVNEDIEKTSKGKWVNKGKEGTHGEFKTKKVAREQQKAMYSKGCKGKKLKEEYGYYKDEPYCEEIADELERGVWIGETLNGTSWDLTINGRSEDEFSSGFAEYLAEEVSYPVRDGHLGYIGIEMVLYKSSMESFFGYNDLNRLIPDLVLLGISRKEINKWLKNTDPDAALIISYNYYIDFDEDKWEENNREDIDLPTAVTYDFYTLVDDNVDIDSDDYNLDDEIAERLSDDYGYNFLDFDYEIDEKSGDVYVYNIKWDLNENLKKAKKKIKESNNGLTTSATKGLSDDEIEKTKKEINFKYYGDKSHTPDNLIKPWKNEDNKEMSELDFREWVNSCLVYGETWRLKPEELKHSDTLKIYRIDFDRALEIIEEQKERFKKARVNYNVHTDEEGVSYNSVDWDLKENIGQDIAEYQKWVDYDMKRYGKISEKTNRKVRAAGLKIVKDIYGDYEVIANEPIRENKKINEAKEEDNPIKDIRTNVLEFENGGDYIDLYIDYKDGKLIAGMTTNAGIVPEYQIEYDDEKSVDENLQDLYDEIVAEHPEYLETIEERNKNS